jgi:hypothetical protein
MGTTASTTQDPIDQDHAGAKFSKACLGDVDKSMTCLEGMIRERGKLGPVSRKERIVADDVFDCGQGGMNSFDSKICYSSCRLVSRLLRSPKHDRERSDGNVSIQRGWRWKHENVRTVDLRVGVVVL